MKNDNEFLIAEFNSDYYLKFTKLFVMVEQTRKWKHREYTYYKKYVYPVRLSGEEQTYSYVIPLEDLNLGEDQKITFAAMAWVSDNPGKSRRRQLFGLAEDNGDHQHRRWQRWLIDYEVVECSATIPEGFCTIAWPDAEQSYTYSEDQTGYFQSYTLSFNDPLEFVNHTLLAEVDSKLVPVGTVDITYSFNIVYIIVDLDIENYPGIRIDRSRAYISPASLLNTGISPESFDFTPGSSTDSRASYTITGLSGEILYISVATWICNE